MIYGQFEDMPLATQGVFNILRCCIYGESIHMPVVDESKLRQLAQQQGVMPFVYQTLKHEFPDDTWQPEWKELYRQQSVRCIKLAHVAATVCDIGGKCGIQVVPFKGIVLGEQLYGGYTERSTTDLDLFVLPRDVPRLVESLEAHGFKRGEAGKSLASMVKSTYSLHLHYQGVIIDLQWHLSNGWAPLPQPVQTLIGQTEPLKVANYVFNVFNPELTLYLLCVHGANNQWRRLRYVLDLALFLRSFPHWRGLTTPLEKSGLEPMFDIGYGLVRRLLWRQPAIFYIPFTTASEQYVSRLAQRFARDTAEPLLNVRQTLHYDLTCRRRVRDRYRYVFHKLRPKKVDWERQGYRSLPGAAWMRRLWRLLRPPSTLRPRR